MSKRLSLQIALQSYGKCGKVSASKNNKQMNFKKSYHTTMKTDINVPRQHLSHALIPIWRDSSFTVLGLEFLCVETAVSLW